jgi:cytoskeletal protein CcmA (bactofilin family)
VEHLVLETELKTLEVACPNCGHLQPQPRTAYSTRCKDCGQHFRLQEVLHPVAKPAKANIERRIVACFQCGSQLEVAPTAVSTMCRKCSSYVDLSDYQVNQTVTKSFRTHGRLMIEPKGYLLNTEAVVGDAIIKGRLIGRLVAHRTLEVHSTARITGKFTAGRLLIPSGQCFHWLEPIRVDGVEIWGELVANVCAAGTVRLKAGGRCFGDVQAANLVVEDGAILVGSLHIGICAVPK